MRRHYTILDDPTWTNQSPVFVPEAPHRIGHCPWELSIHRHEGIFLEKMTNVIIIIIIVIIYLDQMTNVAELILEVISPHLTDLYQALAVTKSEIPLNYIWAVNQGLLREDRGLNQVELFVS